MPKKQKKIRIKLIANPGSGQMTGNALLEQVTRCLQDGGADLDVALAHPNEEAVPMARKAARDGYKIVVAMGGDDTIWAVMRGLAGSKARLGVIAGGTSNNVARALGIPLDPQAACELILSGRARKMDLGQIKVKGRKKFLFFEVVTVGVASALYSEVKEIPKGNLAGIKDAVLTVLKQPARPKVYLTLDRKSKIKVKTMLVTVSNMPIMGDHFLVAPYASTEDGILDISVYPEFGKAELAAYFAQVKDAGESPRNGKVQRYRARRLKIKTTPKMEVLADGTLLGKGTVKIKLRPRAVRVIAPPPGEGMERPPAQTASELPAPVAPTAPDSDGNAK